MISLQRFLVSVLLILSVTFVFFAQSAEASKGPKITHKVCKALLLSEKLDRLLVSYTCQLVVYSALRWLHCSNCTS